jgi:prepilin-type N-terminal cleavage/methylation domain-containing protein
MVSLRKTNNRGFTMVEIVMVIVIIGVLAGLTYSYAAPRYRNRTYYTRAVSELNTLGNASTLYIAKYNDYPADVSRDIPAGMKEFIQSDGSNNSWPDAPWPGTVYDYENWPPDGNGPLHTYQISIRFCAAGADAVCKANAQKFLTGYVDSTTLNNWDALSSVYFCIKGSCRSHQSRPISHPGFCINCGQKSQFF